LNLARTSCLRLHTRQFFHSYSSRLHFSLPERAVISVDAIAELAGRRTEQRSAWHFAAQIALDEASVGEVIGRSHFFSHARCLRISRTHVEGRSEGRSLVFILSKSERTIPHSDLGGCCFLLQFAFLTKCQDLSSRFVPNSLPSQFTLCICFQDMNFRPGQHRFASSFDVQLVLRYAFFG
jgi:hypothetical protein